MVINSASKRGTFYIRDFREQLPQKKKHFLSGIAQITSQPPLRKESMREKYVWFRVISLRPKLGLVKITAVKTNNDNKFWNILD